MKKVISIILLSCTFLAGCSDQDLYDKSLAYNEAQVTDMTQASRILAALPAPEQPLPVAVYDFQDQTGQFKNNTQYADYSSAVTKGGLSVLVNALLESGGGRWFMVTERGGLNNLLKERQIIRTMRADYTSADGTRLGDLPPMVYAGMLLEGGIIFYDSNIVTGGAAAGYFGLGGSAQYRKDVVTVYLRATDVSNGQVILSVNSSKTVFSYGLNAIVARFLSVDHLLELESGYTVNEPGQLAVRQAIETALYSLIMEGAMRGTWNFADAAAGQKAVTEYLARKNGSHQSSILETKKEQFTINKVPPKELAAEPVPSVQLPTNELPRSRYSRTHQN